MAAMSKRACQCGCRRRTLLRDEDGRPNCKAKKKPGQLRGAALMAAKAATLTERLVDLTRVNQRLWAKQRQQRQQRSNEQSEKQVAEISRLSATGLGLGRGSDESYGFRDRLQGVPTKLVAMLKENEEWELPEDGARVIHDAATRCLLDLFPDLQLALHVFASPVSVSPVSAPHVSDASPSPVTVSDASA